MLGVGSFEIQIDLRKCQWVDCQRYKVWFYKRFSLTVNDLRSKRWLNSAENICILAVYQSTIFIFWYFIFVKSKKTQAYTHIHWLAMMRIFALIKDRDKFYNMCMTLYGWFKRLSLFTRSKSEKNLRKTLIDDMLKDSTWNRNNDFELFNSIYRFRWFLFEFWTWKIFEMQTPVTVCGCVKKEMTHIRGVIF